jgi:pre-rRNA-processing protein TSR1
MSAPVARTSKKSQTMIVEPVVLTVPDPSSADSLVSSNDPDELANEQTWPTEEEMQGVRDPQPRADLPDAKTGITPKSVKRIPKGMSEYQAAWIIDSDDGGDEDEDDEEGGDGDGDGSSDAEMKAVEEDLPEETPAVEEEYEMKAESRKSINFQDLCVEEEAKQSEPFDSPNL